MFAFVKTASGWIGKEFETIIIAAIWSETFAMNGDVVAFCDDADYFASEIGILKHDIELVE